jgi:hypothetical protein
VELLLRAQNKWDLVLDKYGLPPERGRRRVAGRGRAIQLAGGA